jgi:hypothetical protein
MSFLDRAQRISNGAIKALIGKITNVSHFQPQLLNRRGNAIAPPLLLEVPRATRFKGSPRTPRSTFVTVAACDPWRGRICCNSRCRQLLLPGATGASLAWPIPHQAIIKTI